MADVVFEVHVHPGARRTALVGWHAGAVKVDVAAPARDGRANDTLVAYLAQQFGVRRAEVVIESGHSARRKRVRVIEPGLDPLAALGEPG